MDSIARCRCNTSPISGTSPQEISAPRSASASIAGLAAANMAEALKSDFIHLERVLGLSQARILLKHALRNAALPIVTYIGLQFGLILGGAIVTERVFAWPGIGQRIVE